MCIVREAACTKTRVGKGSKSQQFCRRHLWIGPEEGGRAPRGNRIALRRPLILTPSSHTVQKSQSCASLEIKGKQGGRTSATEDMGDQTRVHDRLSSCSAMLGNRNNDLHRGGAIHGVFEPRLSKLEQPVQYVKMILHLCAM